LTIQEMQLALPESMMESHCMALIPKSYGATPTWRGLLVKGLDGKGTTTLVRWDRLEESPRGSWHVRDHDGNRVKHGRHAVKVWVNGDRATRLARRLHHHHLKPAWNSGQLQLTVTCRKHYFGPWFMALLCLAAGIAMSCLSAVRLPEFWNPDPPFLESRHLILLRLIVAAWFLGAGLLIGMGLLFLPWKRWRPNAQEVFIDRQGIHARSFDGGDRLLPWETVCEIKRALTVTRIEAAGQEPVIIPYARPRPPAWDHFFAVSLPRQIIERQERKRRNARLRVHIWLAVGISLYIPSVWLVADHPTLTPVQVVSLATAIYILTGLMVIGLVYEKTFKRTLRTMLWKRRRRLASKAASGNT
jgi:hypothetical protein